MKHVLRVEYQHNGRPRACIVKINSPERLQRELQGWFCCQRPNEGHGPLFQGLSAGLTVDGQFQSLVYEDAANTHRAAKLIPLEEAVLKSCRWGTPVVNSIETVLENIFTDAAYRLYRRGKTFSSTADIGDEIRTRLAEGVHCWTTPGTRQHSATETATELLPSQVAELLDPVTFADRVLAHSGVMPDLRRGCAHGDLHGRNILVSVGADHVQWPLIFDYDAMGTDLLQGWDFVKLELELKVRTIQCAIFGDETEFIDQLLNFEESLCALTETLNNQPDWKPVIDSATPRDRLMKMVLAIRKQARDCLDSPAHATRNWLHEYYFLLAVYGVYAGKFSTLQRRELIAIYLCAATAVTHFGWAKGGRSYLIEAARQQARQALQANNADVRSVMNQGINHKTALSFAEVFSRSRDPKFLLAAREILKALALEYPYVAAIHQELVLVHLRAS